MNGTLISINDVSATLDFINQTTAKQERKTIPIGGAVRPHVDFLNKNMIGKPVEFTVKKDVSGKDQLTFVGKPKKDFKSGQEIAQEDQKMIIGLLWAADEANYKVQSPDGKTHVYCYGPLNRHIRDKAVEFGTFPLKIRYSFTKDAFLSPQSQILGVPTQAEITALIPPKEAEETKPNPTSTKEPQQYVCEVCGVNITEADKSRSRLFYSKTLCPEHLAEENARQKKVVPDAKKPMSEKEGIAPPNPEPKPEEKPVPDNTDTAQPLTPGMAKAISMGAITGLQKDKLIVLQSSLKVAADLYPADMNMDYDQACDEVVEKAIQIANRLIEEAVK